MYFLKRKKSLGYFLLLGVLLCANIFAQEKPLQLYEQKIKAGLVYNLLKYTAWPPGTLKKDVLQVCLYGKDPFDGYLYPLSGRTAQQVPIVVTEVTRFEEMTACSVVIIHHSEEKNLAELLKFMEDKNALTISDIAQFSQRGGMVEMTKEEEKISLYVNTRAVAHAGLNIDERMLKLAKIVSG